MGVTDRVVPMAWPHRDDGFGLLSAPDASGARWGVLVVVGGPQTRVGAHRHFVTLARQLAEAGVPTLRFDHRGLGDHGGPLQPFDALDEDLAAGIEALMSTVPGLDSVVLWGLCDGASAALLYTARRADPRVRALVLLNPWVRSARGEARTRIQHYYLERLRSPEFWRKLLRGGVGLRAMAGWWHLRQQARDVSPHESKATVDASFQSVMAQGWARFKGPILLQLSGKDHTAREFEGVDAVFAAWKGWRNRAQFTEQTFVDADHTFSQRRLQDASTQALIAWMRGLT